VQLVGASLFHIRLKPELLSSPFAYRLGQGERKLSKPAGAVAVSFKRGLAVRPSPDAPASEILKWLSQCGVSLSAATASSLSALPLSGAKLRELAALPKQAPAGGDSRASLDRTFAAVSSHEDRAALVELISTFGACSAVCRQATTVCACCSRPPCMRFARPCRVERGARARVGGCRMDRGHC
jgi:hypothetical protein